MKIVNIIWRKPVSTYAISACEAFVASVNSVNNSEKTEGNEPTFRQKLQGAAKQIGLYCSFSTP